MDKTRGQMVALMPDDLHTRSGTRMVLVNGSLLHRPIRCTYCGRTKPRGFRVLSPRPFQWGSDQMECCDASTPLPFFPPTFPHVMMNLRRNNAAK